MSLKLEAVGVIVADMERSLDFYRRLGASFPEGAEQEDHNSAELGVLHLMLDTEESVRSFDPGWTRGRGSPPVSLAFRCEDSEDLDATYARLTEADPASAHKEPWDAFWGQRYAQLRDPDGNGVDLFADLESGQVGG